MKNLFFSCAFCFLIPITLSSFEKNSKSYLEAKMSSFSYADAAAKLNSIGETHLLNKWSSLNPDQQMVLLKEIEQIDIEIFKRQQAALSCYLKKKSETANQEWAPFNDFNQAGSESQKRLGKRLIAEGKVGCLLVAGGQGTRLSFDAPKGTFPVSLIKQKSLFQIFAEKTIAASKQAHHLLPLAIMTSPLNHEATLDFFKKHQNFGLADEQLYFFCQPQLPFIDNESHLILKNDFLIAKGPDGNGSSLAAFLNSGIWEIWNHQGIKYVNYILVDNPLADPFDAELIGFHQQNECEITVKCVERAFPDERVGLLVNSEKGVQIVEYTEIQDQERIALNTDGRLKHRCTNISLFCFSMDFIKRAASSAALPWHFAHKAVSYNGPLGWKFETYIFDYLTLAERVKALLYPRSQCFAPLKNGSGLDSLNTVQEALLQNDKASLESICGHPVNCGIIELDEQFHYPTEEILQKWKGKKGPFEGYITP